MKIFITGICGFVGSTLAVELRKAGEEVCGCDTFIRPGSELNRRELARLGVKIIHADVRSATDFAMPPPADWVIDAAANPSVLAGVDGRTSSRQLLEHNLWGTVNVLEYCKAHRAGLILLSTSRVYSVPPLAALPDGVSEAGVREDFSTAPPVSLYGASKLASEILALEYAETFGIPVWVNRCGVLAGAGQFGRPDQGIFAFWIHSHLRRRPLKYINFDGHCHQVRDCLSARPCAVAARPDEKRRPWQAAHPKPERRRDQQHVARATHGLVQRTFRRSPGSGRFQSAPVRHPVGGAGFRTGGPAMELGAKDPRGANSD